MNVYQVVSEELTGYYNVGEFSVPEPYCIACLVAAKSPGQAKWIAWKSDFDFRRHGPSVVDMPKFSVKMVRKNEDWPEGILPDGLYHLWDVSPRSWLLPEATLFDRYIESDYRNEYGEDHDWDG